MGGRVGDVRGVRCGGTCERCGGRVRGVGGRVRGVGGW